MRRRPCEETLNLYVEVVGGGEGTGVEGRLPPRPFSVLQQDQVSEYTVDYLLEQG